MINAKSIPIQNGSSGVSPIARADSGGAPVITVVRGQPTYADIAALVTVLLSRAHAGTAALACRAGPAEASRSGWAHRSHLMRQPVTTGHGAWKRSALPR